jgi:nitroreductase
MEFSDVIKKRRSVRKYSDKKVPEQVITKALRDALLAPNSSNLQPWEFYWVKNPERKAKLVEACFNQLAAKTAPELVVVVSRLDTWNRNRKLIIEQLKQVGARKSNIEYYSKLIPFIYTNDPLNILGFLKGVLTSIIGLFKATPRVGTSRSGLFEVATKTTALACENFMLSVVDQGYSCCPMEGFDECRVKQILSLPRRNSHIVMVISVGEAATDGIWGEQTRLPEKLFLFEA